jgi:hypothetical protein
MNFSPIFFLAMSGRLGLRDAHPFRAADRPVVFFARRYHRLDVDLHHPFRPRQPVHDEAGRAGIDAFQPLANGAVDRLAIGAIGDVHGDLADMLEAASRLLEQLLHLLHRLIRLGGRIADADHAAVERLADLTAQEDAVAGPDRHAEIVVEALLGIGDLGVELA